MGAHAVEPDELLALFLARELVGSTWVAALGKGLDRLWAKLSASSGQPLLMPATDAPFRVRGIGAIDYTPHRATLACLEQAAVTRTAVRCRFRRSRTGEISERVIEPGEIYLDASLEALYCIAWCRLRNDVRVFAVHRFLEAALTDERFAHRPETRSRVALHTAFRVWRGANIERVRLAFSARVSDEIHERRWHPSQVITPTTAGGVLLEMSVAEPAELVRWLLGFAGEVEVLEPVSLRDAVRDGHRDAIRGGTLRAVPASTESSLSRSDTAPAQGGLVAPKRGRRNKA
jgi:predicted DNA-binding transcriptional regulator YafY